MRMPMKDPYDRCQIRLAKYELGECNVKVVVNGLKIPITLTPCEAIQLVTDLMEVGVRRDPTIHRLIKAFCDSDRGAI